MEFAAVMVVWEKRSRSLNLYSSGILTGRLIDLEREGGGVTVYVILGGMTDGHYESIPSDQRDD